LLASLARPWPEALVDSVSPPSPCTSGQLHLVPSRSSISVIPAQPGIHGLLRETVPITQPRSSRAGAHACAQPDVPPSAERREWLDWMERARRQTPRVRAWREVLAWSRPRRAPGESRSAGAAEPY